MSTLFGILHSRSLSIRRLCVCVCVCALASIARANQSAHEETSIVAGVKSKMCRLCVFFVVPTQ